MLCSLQKAKHLRNLSIQSSPILPADSSLRWDEESLTYKGGLQSLSMAHNSSFALSA